MELSAAAFCASIFVGSLRLPVLTLMQPRLTSNGSYSDGITMSRKIACCCVWLAAAMECVC